MRNPIRNAINSLFHDPRHILVAILHRMPWLMPNDAQYLRVIYRLHFGKKLNLQDPITFSEKIQWLKLYDHNPLYTTLVDKLRVKKYVAQRIGAKYVIPIIAEWDLPLDVKWDVLPEQFVIKTNHDGGGHGIVICKDKSAFSISKAQKELNYSFSHNSYMGGREWPYKNVPRKVFAEQYLSDFKGELKDYKFFCFNGKVRCFKVDFNRQINHQANYYDTQCQLLPYGETVCPPDFGADIQVPENIHEMMALAEKLAQGIPFVRIDFYNVDGHIYFGEFTFYPAGGMSHWVGDIDVDALWGSWLELPEANHR